MKIYLSLILLLITITTFCQTNLSAFPLVNWQLLDWQKGGYPGMSVEKAYTDYEPIKSR